MDNTKKNEKVKTPEPFATFDEVREACLVAIMNDAKPAETRALLRRIYLSKFAGVN